MGAGSRASDVLHATLIARPGGARARQRSGQLPRTAASPIGGTARAAQRAPRRGRETRKSMA